MMSGTASLWLHHGSVSTVPGAAVIAGQVAHMDRSIRVYDRSARQSTVTLFDMGQSVCPLPSPANPQFRWLITVMARVQWDSEVGAYAAYEDALETWYGLGPTPEAALADLGEVLTEVFTDLEQEENRLAPPMLRQLQLLRRVIAHADPHS